MELEKLKVIEEQVCDEGETKALALAPPSSNATDKACVEDQQQQARRVASPWYIARKHPLLLVAPSLLLVIMIALCVFGVTYATSTRIDTLHDLAQAAARDTADGLRLQLSVVSGAALTLATFVVRDPNWNQLEADFIPVSKEIFRQANQSSSYELAEVQYAPFGKISANYAPPGQARGPVRTDLFAPENVERTEPFVTVKLGGMTINGPLPLTVGGRMAILARYPVFIQNVSRDEDWNHPFNMTAPTGCDEICYDEATRTKFWGFTAAFFYADELLSGEDERLRQLVEEHYEFRLTKSDSITSPSAYEDQQILVKSKGWNDPEPTALVDVRVPGAAWFLAVYTPEIDKVEDMRDGLIAMIVIVSFLLSGLLLMLLVSNKRAALLLDEQLVTNAALEKANDHLINTKRVLEEEKLQREALLGRQFDLISCFERKDSKDSKKGSGKLSPSVADKQLATLEQIAALRRAMDEEQKSQHIFSPSDDIRFYELLGEGTFGKVHRGTWRSTEVAIKTIMLPANMSGAEKREKMVVWEAAISSSLTHPNIVQTYTYSIKPVREQEKHLPGQKSFDSLSGLGSAVQICGDTTENSAKLGNTMPGSSDKSSEGGAIHSFEVSLVLEYCDKGCLRDALDQGAFMTSTGLNYAAILDSAEDVARAMLHLHCNNILHMDLKARNILLASSGSDGRGVTCKASDFGLAVRMEQAETHMSGCFQGTLTHMAPETLLKGQVSKAADVYAFGIVLWELFTGGQPYKGIPKALLGHKVAAEHCRPPLPFVMPHGYQALIQACWNQNPEKRPTFAEILERLEALRSSVPGKTEPLGPITRPLPKGPVTSANKLRPGSLHTVSEHSSHSQPVSAIMLGKAGGAERASVHSMQNAEHAAHATSRSVEEHRRSPLSPAHPMGGSPDLPTGTQGEGHRGGEPGMHLLRRSKSLPSMCHEEDGDRPPEHLPDSGSHVRSSNHDSHPGSGGEVISREGFFPLEATTQVSNDTWLPFAPQQQLSGPANSQPVAEARHLRQSNAEDGMGMPNPRADAQGLTSGARAGPSSSTSGRHHHHGSLPSHRPGQGEAASTSRHSSRWKRDRHSCVMVIGGDDTGTYPENVLKEGSSQQQAKGRVELSSIRTRAVLNMLDPIGEVGEDNQEG